jgi:hypothetical protein
VAAAATMLCGQMMLPTAAPKPWAPSRGSGAVQRRAVVSWNSVKRMFEAVAEPVTKVPSAPTAGASSGQSDADAGRRQWPARRSCRRATSCRAMATMASSATRTGRQSAVGRGGGLAHVGQRCALHEGAEGEGPGEQQRRVVERSHAAPRRRRAAPTRGRPRRAPPAAAGTSRVASTRPTSARYGAPARVSSVPAVGLALGGGAGRRGRTARRGSPGAAGRAGRRRTRAAPSRAAPSVGSSGPNEVAIGVGRRRRCAAARAPWRQGEPPAGSARPMTTTSAAMSTQPSRAWYGAVARAMSEAVRSVAATWAITGVPSAPNETPAAWPIRAAVTAATGGNPACDQERRGQRHRGAEAGGALQEEREEPGDEQGRHPGVGGEAAESGAQGGGGAGALLEVVHGEGRADDGDHRHGDERRLEADARERLRRGRRGRRVRRGRSGRWPARTCRPQPPHRRGRPTSRHPP